MLFYIDHLIKNTLNLEIDFPSWHMELTWKHMKYICNILKTSLDNQVDDPTF